MFKSLLMTPGPTPLPPEVSAAMTHSMVNHRGEAFTAVFTDVSSRLQTLFGTREPVFVFPGAGTGGWEAALVNTLNPGDKVLSVIIGDFGERWYRTAVNLGFAAQRLDFEPGQAADPTRLAERLAADRHREIKAILLQHNETSTGVTNDIAVLARVVREHGALVMVDSVSGLGGMPMAFDDWGLDVALTGAQKALMCPPGLSILAFSERARKLAESNTTPRSFWDLRSVHKSYLKQQTPYTPAISLFFALQAALRLIEEEGLEQVFERHRLMGAMCRAGVKAMGLELLVQDEGTASNTVTAVKSPIAPKALRRIAREQFGVQLAGGQAALEPLIFRIGHMGYMTPNDVIQALAAIENALALHGQEIQLGRAVATAQQVWLNHLKQA